MSEHQVYTGGPLDCAYKRRHSLLASIRCPPPPFLASSSSDRKLDPSDPSEISGRVLPFAIMVDSFEAFGEPSSAVKEVGAMTRVQCPRDEAE